MDDVLIIGGGGREHALGWKLFQSPNVGKLYFSPGNGGTSEIGENVSLDLHDHSSVIEWAQKNNISFVVVAPDDYLADGMVDSLKTAGIDCFGPTKEASKIEWSKAYAKEVMEAAGIPTAKYSAFTNFEDAKSYISNHQIPVVIKASGLALGKGVVIAESTEIALKTLEEFMLEGKHGSAGKEVVVEEFLEGIEFSIHALVDGETALMFPPSQDHKRIFDNDEGPNTGGMGTIAPLSWVKKEDMDQVYKEIVRPIILELKKRGNPFQGLLYPGLMMTKNGPKVIEFNARFGDPETQSYMRLLESDLFELMKASSSGNLHNLKLKWKEGSASCVVLASGGYPESYEKGKKIIGIKDASSEENIVVYHAGTVKESEVALTNGGRVLNVTSTGKNLADSLDKIYKTIEKISFDSMQYRKDIGKKSF